jgi:GxxExxY protein
MEEHNIISGNIVNASYQLHKDLGPGLLEVVYESILEQELRNRGFQVERQRDIPLTYDGLSFDIGFRADLVVNEKVIVELKSVEKVADVHKKQLLTYLRVTGMKLGLLLNFGTNLMKDGIFRIANDL